MDIYKIKGLTDLKQTKKIKHVFRHITGNTFIDIDFQHGLLFVPETVDINELKRISAFEKVTILDFDIEKNNVLNQYEFYLEHYTHNEEIEPDNKTSRNMKIVFWLNLGFAFSEFFFGSLFKSTAILSDAVHDLGDALAIAIAWFFQQISAKDPDQRFSFGYRRFSLLGALVTSVVLIVGSILIIIHTIPKLITPQAVNYDGMFWLSIIAIAIAGFSSWLLSKGTSHNERILNLHLMEDLLGWISVLIVSIIVRYTHWYILDPLLSLCIAIWILTRALPEFINISQIFLQAVPHQINQGTIMENIKKIKGIQQISHLHIWTIEGETHFATVTVKTYYDDIPRHEDIKNQIRLILAQYDITHITIEMIAQPI